MGKPKSHHFLPRGLLRGFAVPGTEKVWVYFPNRPPFDTFVENIACEKYLYAVGDENESRNVMVEERFFAEIDQPISRIVKNMQAHKVLDPDDRKSLAFFIAAQTARTPAYRDGLKVVYG